MVASRKGIGSCKNFAPINVADHEMNPDLPTDVKPVHVGIKTSGQSDLT